ncbi:MAG: hypothetical protein KDA33_05060 [Phycisphaerales bacterium]|nr:hypothetical protein [Phycisphaerales bacterium]
MSATSRTLRRAGSLDAWMRHHPTLTLGAIGGGAMLLVAGVVRRTRRPDCEARREAGPGPLANVGRFLFSTASLLIRNALIAPLLSPDATPPREPANLATTDPAN